MGEEATVRELLSYLHTLSTPLLLRRSLALAALGVVRTLKSVLFPSIRNLVG